MSISGKLVRRSNETPKKAGSNKEADNAGHGIRQSHRGQRTERSPTPEAFEAMDWFTEELVKAGVLVAGAGRRSDVGYALDRFGAISLLPGQGLDMDEHLLELRFLEEPAIHHDRIDLPAVANVLERARFDASCRLNQGKQ